MRFESKSNGLHAPRCNYCQDNIRRAEYWVLEKKNIPNVAIFPVNGRRLLTFDMFYIYLFMLILYLKYLNTFCHTADEYNIFL